MSLNARLCVAAGFFALMACNMDLEERDRAIVLLGDIDPEDVVDDLERFSCTESAVACEAAAECDGPQVKCDLLTAMCAELEAECNPTTLTTEPETQALGCTPPTIAGVPPLARPAESFSYDEYAYMHSSTHLQGTAHTEKFAPGLTYNPADAVFGGLSSAVIVNNLSNVSTATGNIEYRDLTGSIVGNTPFVLGPEQSLWEGALALTSAASNSYGLGSARITSDNPIVGGSILHTDHIATLYDNDPFMPGMASMQQLQIAQPSALELDWGPLPLTTLSSSNFLNGAAPFYWVMNPNPSPNVVQITYTTNTGLVLPTPPIIIPPYGSYWDTVLWYAYELSFLIPNVPVDLDLAVNVQSLTGLPLMGDGVMTDMHPIGERFRMASTMMATHPDRQLINPDFTYETGGFVTTLMAFYNAGTTNTGQITVEYFNRDGTVLATDTYPGGLGPNQSIRVGPGFASSPNYPTGMNTWAGWVRVYACDPNAELVGWSIRETDENPAQRNPSQQFHKAYGELMDGITGIEPGFGEFINDQTYGAFLRKGSPITRVMPSWFWPGETTFVNTLTPNSGPFMFRFYDEFGFDYTNYTGQPYAGLPWAHTASTFEEPIVNFGPANLSGRVDTSVPVQGLDFIGDPLAEYGIPSFPGF